MYATTKTFHGHGWKAISDGVYIRPCKDMDCEWPTAFDATLTAILMTAYHEGVNA